MGDVSQEQLQAELSFQMPHVEHGEVVAWYPSGLRSRRPEVGLCIRTADRNIHVLTALNGVKEAVRHVDDPKLQRNADQREMGAWDFTDAHKQRQQQLSDLQGKLAELKKCVAELTAQSVVKRSRKRAAKPNNKLNEYRQLLAKAREAGIEFSSKPKREWLEAELAKRGVT